MAIVIQQSIATPVDTPAGSATSSSWTPGSNELCLCLIAQRSNSAPDTNISGVSGNGLTWVKVLSKDDTQNNTNLSIYRAMGASPTAGGVTVSWALDPTSVNFQIIRISGVDTTGTNGSGAIGATASADTGASDTNPATTNLTTTRANSRVIGFGAGRGQTWTEGSGFTAILKNQTASSAGNISRSSTEYKDVASSGTNTTVNFSLSAVGDWVMSALEILQPGGTTYNQTVSGSITPSGALLNRANKTLAGSITASGVLLKTTLKTLTGSVTPAGVLLKTTLKKLAGSITASGALVTSKIILKILSGTVSASGSLIKSTNKTLAGTISSSGSLVRRTLKTLSGSISASGVLTAGKVFLKILSGSITASGALLKTVNKSLSGSITPSGALQKITSKILSGVVTPVGSLVRSTIDRVFRQKRKISTFESKNLSFTVTAPAWGGSNFWLDVTQEVVSYDHSIAALGGFWSANVSLKLPLSEVEDWVSYGIGRQLQVKGRGTKIAWEGIVNRISVNIGGYSITVGPYTDICNKIKLTYSMFLQLGGGNATGIRVVTGYLSDANSQSRYGILERNFSVGGIEASAVSGLQSMLLERYSKPNRSEDLNLPGDDSLRTIDVKLECIGYSSLFQKYTYNSSTTGTQNLSAKIDSIVAAEPNGLFSSQTTVNTMAVPAYENDDSEAWGLIKGLVAMGDVSNNRYIFGVYENRRCIYKPVSNSIVYIRPLREGANVIQDSSGGIVQPWEVRPGTYIWVSDLLPGSFLEADLNDDKKVIFAETVQFRMPDSLVVNGAHQFRVEQRLAQLGLKGVS